MRVLIIGGYGTFGGRLVRLLADDACFTLCVAGRSTEKAKAFCAALSAQARLLPVAFDRAGNVETQLTALAPDIVVDASGPFQAYGDAPYRVVKACLALRIDYLDLADARSFVEGIARFDAEAKAAGVTVLSGASTLPALSTAVLRRLSEGMRMRDVAIGIAPSPYAGMGLNVIRMIAGYAGKPVRLLRRGQTTRAPAMIDARWFTIAPPGCLPVRRRRFALADTPDLTFVPQLWPEVRSVWAGAGTAPVVWQIGLSALSWLVHLKLLRSLSFLAPLFHWVSNHLVWGELRGGMFVHVVGEDGGTRSWHMIAEGDDGPFIPSMAAFALLRKWADGERPPVGARPCIADLSLEDFERVFARFRIASDMTEHKLSDAALPLYRRLLGPAWNALPDPIRAMHDGTARWQAEGRARVERGTGPIARIAAALFGFPKAGDDVPVTVVFDARNGAETWTRNFAGTIFSSEQFEGARRDDGLMHERFGPFRFAIALAVEADRLRLVVRGWSMLGIPLPCFLAPRGDTYEFVEDGRFHFHVEIGFRWTGLIVRYRGWLVRTRQ